MLVTSETFDLERGANSNFRIDVVSVTLTSLTYRVTSITEKPLYAYYVRWFAILDAFTEVRYFDMATPELKKGGKRPDVVYEQVLDIEFERQYSSAPNVAVFIIGYNSVGGPTTQVFLSVRQITPNGCKIVAQNDNESLVESVQVSLIAFPKRNTHMSKIGYIKTRANNIFFQGGGERTQKYSLYLPNQIANNKQLAVFQGFSGFNYDNKVNFRLKM